MKTSTNYTIFIVVIVIALITVTVMGIGNLKNQNIPNKPTSAPVVDMPEPTIPTTILPTETAEPSQIPSTQNPADTPINNNDNPTVNQFDRIWGLNYIILRNIFTSEGDILFDILTETEFTDEQIILIGKKVHQIYSENNNVKQMNYNVFSKKEAFEKTIKEDYNNQQLEGFTANFIAIAGKVKYNRYFTFNNDTSFEFDKIDYSVESVIAEASPVTIHVICNSAVKGDIWDTGKGLAYIIKDLNKKLESIIIYFYADQGDLKANNPKWMFDERYPKFITQTSQFALMD